MVQLKDSLPVYFTDIYEVDAILGVVSKEIDRLYGVIYAYGNYPRLCAKCPNCG